MSDPDQLAAIRTYVDRHDHYHADAYSTPNTRLLVGYCRVLLAEVERLTRQVNWWRGRFDHARGKDAELNERHLRNSIATVTRERDQARREVERLTTAIRTHRDDAHEWGSIVDVDARNERLWAVLDTPAAGGRR